MPHEKVREENKKRVIEEAARLFKENGLEKTTIEMIANAAGLTKRSVQNYYETKNAIILDVFRLHEKNHFGIRERTRKQGYGKEQVKQENRQEQAKQGYGKESIRLYEVLIIRQIKKQFVIRKQQYLTCEFPSTIL